MVKHLHVVKNHQTNEWQLKQDGGQRSSGNFLTQKKAIQRGRQIAQNQQEELSIHGVDGKIREAWSYGNDPRNIPG
jgi:hypothetical protein